MALLLMEGCDLYNDQDDLRDAGRGAYLAAGSNRMGYDPTGGRYGGGAILGGTTVASGLGWEFPALALGSTFYFGFWFRPTLTVGSTQQIFCQLSTLNADTRILSLQHTVNGTVQATNNANASVSSASGVLTTDTWHWIEGQVVIGTNATNGSYDIRVNGSTVVSASGIDTFPATNNVVGEFKIYGAQYARRFDDIVLWSGSGAAPNAFIGESRIDTLRPNADGGALGWTASAGSQYQCVDDVAGSHNNDTDYISATTATTKSRFAMSNLPGTATTVHAVQVRGRARVTASQAKTLRGYINSSATEANGTTRGLQGTYGVHRLGMFTTNPNGGGAWTDTTVNAVQAGVEVIS